MAQFRIEATAGALPVLVLGNQRVPGVTALAFDAQPGELPRVTVQIVGEGVIEGEGIVHVEKAGDDRQAVLDMIDGLDPDEVDRVALASLGFGDAGNLTPKIIGYVREQVARL